MFGNIVKYVAAATLVVSVASCGKEATEPQLSQEAKGFGLGFSADVEVLESGATTVDELKGVGYDLVGDKKVPVLNFLNMVKDKTLNPTGTNKKLVPVHLFFVNTKMGINSRRYYRVLMDVEGKTELALPFQEFPEIRKIYTDATADYWYVKAFIGGQRLKPVSGGIVDGTEGIQFCQDGLYDITEDTNVYVPLGTPDTHYTANGSWRFPYAMPMETAWTRVDFYFNEGEGNETPNHKYPAIGKAPRLKFKPFGSIIRMGVKNTTQRTYNVKVLDFSPTPWKFKNPDQTELMQKIIYVNNGAKRFTESTLASIPLTADGAMAPEVLADPSIGMDFSPSKDGTVQYFSGPRKATNTLSATMVSLPMAPGKTRFFFFWVIEDKTTALSETFVQPYLHDTNNKAGLTDTDKLAVKPLYLGNAEHGIKVKRGQYESGKTYYVGLKLKDDTTPIE